MIMDGTKGYIASVCLGKATNTQDAEGEVVKEAPFSHVTKEMLLSVLSDFVGEIEQIPPMYSAIKINGQKLYNLARKGVEVERKPRKVEIYDISLLEENLKEGTFKIMVHCSKGTYIRTLCEDLGVALNSCAYMESLIRCKCGRFSLDSAITLEEFEELWKSGKADTVMLSPADVLKETPLA